MVLLFLPLGLYLNYIVYHLPQLSKMRFATQDRGCMNLVEDVLGFFYSFLLGLPLYASKALEITYCYYALYFTA